jgi:uncharacterized membrane protein
MATKKELIITDEDALLIAKKMYLGRLTVWICLCGLLLTFTITNLMRESGSIKMLLTQLLPLLLFIPGLLKNFHRTYSWLCFVVLMYFIAIVPLLMSRWWISDWILLIFICILFIAAMMTSRWVQHWNYYSYKKSISEKNMSQTNLLQPDLLQTPEE